MVGGVFLRPVYGYGLSVGLRLVGDQAGTGVGGNVALQEEVQEETDLGVVAPHVVVAEECGRVGAADRSGCPRYWSGPGPGFAETAASVRSATPDRRPSL